jgi:hypothetical protein
VADTIRTVGSGLNLGNTLNRNANSAPHFMAALPEGRCRVLVRNPLEAYGASVALCRQAERLS